MVKILEKDIQNAICDYLAMKHYFFWRQNTAPTFDRTQQSYRRMPKHSMTGIPDIILIKQGIFYGLEVKTSTGKQSENQKIFEDGCKNAGGEYYIVASIDDVIKIGL